MRTVMLRRMLPLLTRLLLLLFGAFAALVACDQHADNGKGARSQAASGVSESSICKYLRATEILTRSINAAEGERTQRQVAGIVSEIELAARVAPPEMRRPLDDLALGLHTTTPAGLQPRRLASSARALAQTCRANGIQVRYAP